MPRIYLLSDHDEYGSEHVRAFDSREKFKAAFAETIARMDAEADGWGTKYYGKCPVDQRIKDAEDLPGMGQPLSEGWGGYQVHAVDLE